MKGEKEQRDDRGFPSRRRKKAKTWRPNLNAVICKLGAPTVIQQISIDCQLWSASCNGKNEQERQRRQCLGKKEGGQLIDKWTASEQLTTGVCGQCHMVA